uniref:Uncharacterized protein n=1 Tax=Anguilla anguilla TaxID=7936 RepID=A0A0E9SMX8_ANGAN
MHKYVSTVGSLRPLPRKFIKHLHFNCYTQPYLTRKKLKK